MEGFTRRHALALSLTALPMFSSTRSLAQDRDAQLYAALQDHHRYSAGFREKLRSGLYRLPSETPSIEMIRRTFEMIKARLGSLADDTLAIIHHVGFDSRLRAWLLSKEGLIANSISGEPYVGLGYLQRGLQIDRRMQTRAAVLRSGVDVPLSPSQQGPQLSGAEALRYAAEQLLGPSIIEALSTRRGRLLILPAKDTGTAPFSALPLTDSELVCDRFSVVVIPDIETLANRTLVHNVSQINWRSTLMVGDPDLSRDRDFKFAPLPGARAEVEAIKELLQLPEARVLVGGDAQLTQVVQKSHQYGETDVVYLATHAVANERNPMDGSFVALTGGHLTGTLLRSKTFEAWGARHPLVVLSACQTALGKTFDGGSYGLSRAFFAAGAAQVVSSLWSVDDAATALLMTNFMEKLSYGFPTERALRAAQIVARQTYSGDPGAWASFSVFGMPGATDLS